MVSLAVPAAPRTSRAAPADRSPARSIAGPHGTRGGQRCPSEDASGAPARRAAPTTASAPTPRTVPGRRLTASRDGALPRRLDPNTFDADLRAVLLEGHRRQLQLDPVPQTGRRGIPTAAALDQRLELLLDAELA